MQTPITSISRTMHLGVRQSRSRLRRPIIRGEGLRQKSQAEIIPHPWPKRIPKIIPTKCQTHDFNYEKLSNPCTLGKNLSRMAILLGTIDKTQTYNSDTSNLSITSMHELLKSLLLIELPESPITSILRRAPLTQFLVSREP